MVFKSRFSLADYGEDFVNSYIVVGLFDRNQMVKYAKKVKTLTAKLKDKDEIESVDDSVEVLDAVYGQAADQFIEGVIFDEGVERPMKKADVLKLPVKVVQDLIQFIQGSLEKKA